VNKVPKTSKVFICHDGYQHLAKYLEEERGWVRNKAYNSPCFDFKYTMHKKDINFINLPSTVKINHFNKV
jgi:hypothetical protein